MLPLEGFLTLVFLQANPALYQLSKGVIPVARASMNAVARASRNAIARLVGMAYTST